MAKNASRWAMKNWTPGSTTLAQNLGLGSWHIRYPKLQASLQNQAIAAQVNPSGNTGNGSGAPLGGTGPINGCTSQQTQANQKLGQQIAATYGWGSGQEWTALNDIVMSESGWCNVAQNPGSTAYGIGQFLDTTWSTVGGTKTSNASVQVKLMLAYIKARYNTPTQAWAFHKANNYY